MCKSNKKNHKKFGLYLVLQLFLGIYCHDECSYYSSQYCGGACHSEDYKQFPGYQYDFVGKDCDCDKDAAPAADTAKNDAELVAQITKQVMAQLGLK